MHRKTCKTFLTIGATMLFVLIAHAITISLPSIPTPKISATDAISRMEAFLKAQPQTAEGAPLLVAVEWCRGDQFEAGLSDGTMWHVLKAKEEWSWFFTYAVRAEDGKSYSSVRVMRLRDNGEIGGLIGTNT